MFKTLRSGMTGAASVVRYTLPVLDCRKQPVVHRYSSPARSGETLKSSSLELLSSRDFPSDIELCHALTWPADYYAYDFIGVTLTKKHCLATPVASRDWAAAPSINRAVRFLRVTHASWCRQSAIHPLRCTQGYAIVPLVGSIYANGEALSPAALSALGLEIIDQSDGSPFALRGITHGGRSLIFPNSSPGTVATQYLGVGTDSYTGHLGSVDRIGRVTKHRDDQVVFIDSEWRESYSNQPLVRPYALQRSGIFLDIDYDLGDPEPVGAKFESNVQTELERDEMLIRAGAILSGQLTDYVPLLRGSDWHQLGLRENLYVSARRVFDTTIRLDRLGQSQIDGSIPALQFAADVFPNGKDIAINGYISHLLTTVGRNLNICARLKLGVLEGQRTAQNLSALGGIVDSESFINLQHPYALFPLFRNWIGNVADVFATLGIREDDFVRSGFASELLESTLAGSEEDNLAEILALVDSHNLNQFCVDATAVWIIQNCFPKRTDDLQTLAARIRYALASAPLYTDEWGVFEPQRLMVPEYIEGLGVRSAAYLQILQYLKGALIEFSPRHDVPEGDTSILPLVLP